MADKNIDSSSESSEDLLREDSEGWEDAEPDEETLQVKDFFSDKTFPDAVSMIKYCAETHGVDFMKIQKGLGLDFYGSIKLANYLRSEAQKGNSKPDVSSKEAFQDDRYLQPVLEDDALLFCLDDLDSTNDGPEEVVATDSGDSNASVTELRERLAALQSQFDDYREAVAKTLDERWTDNSDEASSSKAPARGLVKSIDESYFDSYSYNDIHQVMLQDSVRTNAYRDFIYGNKHLFAGKVVLDVGCGTGILSMFCAKAGASRVISVDNSSIIEKAKPIVAANGLDDRITFVRGKIEQIILPDGIKQVDIIVSEWMGYCLLFEAMFDSVIYARDKYLKPDGLMVPSHCTLQIAPLEDPEYVLENFGFWKDVYGFDMTAMTEKIHDDVIVRYPEKSAIAGRSREEMPFKVLNLHTITTTELEFEEPFEIKLSRDIDGLDGWCIWFDTIFMPSKQDVVPKHLLQGVKAKGLDAEKQIVFTTGPFGPRTHWQCGTCIIDHGGKAAKALKNELSIDGKVSFKKNKEHNRALDIEIQWTAAGEESESGKQRWFME